MNRCLRIVITAQFPDDFLQVFIQKNAKKLRLEGVAQLIDPKAKQVRIIVCGEGDALDEFVDAIHEGLARLVVRGIEIEPFLKDKDYREVFRIIE